MSGERVPSRSEVMSWSPQQLADYLKRMSLTGCDKAVLKYSISGSRFVNISDNDLQKFPKLNVPLVSKLSAEISKREERRGLFGKKIPPTRITPPKFHEPAAAEFSGWDDGEFDDDDFDDDYESPYSGDEDGSAGDYESPNDDPDGANDYEPPPSEPAEDLPPKINSTLPHGDYIDNRDNHVSTRGRPPAISPRPPVPADPALSPRMPRELHRRDPSPRSTGLPAGKPAPEPPQVFRENKPGRMSGSNFHSVRGLNTPERPGTHPRRPQLDVPDTSFRAKPLIPPPSSTSVSRSNSSLPPPLNRFDMRQEQPLNDGPKHNTFPLIRNSTSPRPGPAVHPGIPPSVASATSLPPKVPSVMSRGSFSGSDRSRPPFPKTHTQVLDPRWYVGKVTRGQAERCLKQVNKDGAFLVRDSSRQVENQPYTLMVLYQDKVYNIQIREQNQQFQLGTGLKVQELFPAVCDIINYYSKSPLVLINAKSRTPSHQNQCMLLDPAGVYMTRLK